MRIQALKFYFSLFDSYNHFNSPYSLAKRITSTIQLRFFCLKKRNYLNPYFLFSFLFDYAVNISLSLSLSLSLSIYLFLLLSPFFFSLSFSAHFSIFTLSFIFRSLLAIIFSLSLYFLQFLSLSLSHTHSDIRSLFSLLIVNVPMTLETNEASRVKYLYTKENAFFLNETRPILIVLITLLFW